VLEFSYSETQGYTGPAGYSLTDSNGEFTLIDPDGGRWTFEDFGEGSASPGGFLTGPDANGNRETLEAFDPEDPDNPNAEPYTEAGNLKGLRSTYTLDSGTVTHAYVFGYGEGGAPPMR